MTKPKVTPDSAKLTAQGQAAERLLESILKDMADDVKLDRKERLYSLTDQMKVVDRVAKFEAIKAKINDGEGSMFTDLPDDDEGAGDEQ